MTNSSMNEFQTECLCVVKNREHMETQREWLKRCMCQHHWQQTDYYQDKLERNRFFTEKEDEPE